MSKKVGKESSREKQEFCLKSRERTFKGLL